MKSLKIVKIGGSIIENPSELKDFLEGFAKMKGPKILVHGGGNLASNWTKKLNIPVQITEGRRITDAQTLEIVTMVYAGKINKTIVAQLQAKRCNAIGFTGADGNAIVAKKRPVNPLDFGFVGDIVTVDSEILNLLLAQGICLVFCALTHDQNGQMLNTNADAIASHLAAALTDQYKVSLYYCFEKQGVLRNLNDDQSVIKSIDPKSYKELLKQHTIAKGMLPKLSNSFYALNNNVDQVCIGTTAMLFQSNALCTTVIK